MLAVHLNHEQFMHKAIQQALKVPNCPFGAVLVEATTGVVFAEGYNRTSENPTYHGEIDVINKLAKVNPSPPWQSLILYTTAEPCPMCQAAIAWAGIPTVVYGSSIPLLKSLGWWQIDIRAQEIAAKVPFSPTVIIAGILEKECNALFEAV